jgi:Reverse transcriptase (RNA-dependent DNA polymerase)
MHSHIAFTHSMQNACPPGLVYSDNKDEDSIEIETLQNNRSIPSTTRIFLMNTESEREGSSSISLYTDRDVSKSKQKSNVTKQQSKAPAACETRTSYNLQSSGGKLASVPFWKKTNLKKSTFICVHNPNVPIPNNNPKTREEVLTRPDADKWIEAMKTELNSQYHQGTFKLDILPPGRKLVTCKWVFKLKKNPDGSILKYKTWLVAQGFIQRKRLDYEEIFALMARITST